MADSLHAPKIVPFPDAGSRPKLLDHVRHAIRTRHYSRRTEQAYVHWIRRYIVFHDKKHPSTMGAPEIAKYLSWLATERRSQLVDAEPGVQRRVISVQTLTHQEWLPALAAKDPAIAGVPAPSPAATRFAPQVLRYFPKGISLPALAAKAADLPNRSQSTSWGTTWEPEILDFRPGSRQTPRA